MPSKKEWLLGGAIALLLLLLINLPLKIAFTSPDTTHVFSGLLYNPTDGNSYLAKMRQGYEGAWSFVLPYSANPGEGAPINLYYLFLGHVANWTNSSLIITFHFARLLTSFLLLIQIFRLSWQTFEEDVPRWIVFLLASLGLGMGWLALPFGMLTPDFWLSEAFPLLAIQANAHFPLGLALQLYFFRTASSTDPSWKALGLSAVFGLVLALVYPFGFVISLAILAIQTGILTSNHAERIVPAKRLLATGVLGGPLLLAQWLIIQAHPALSIWDAQNQTPMPAVLPLLIAFSPGLFLSLLYLAKSRGALTKIDLLLVVWLGAAFSLAILPFNLQRRLLSGVSIPITFLAIKALWFFVKGKTRRCLSLAVLSLLVVPTTLILLISETEAVKAKEPALFLSVAEADALQWISENAPPDSLIAAAPQTGLYLPAKANVRVLYGHPFETVNAERWELELVSLFSGDIVASNYLERNDVDLVFYGPREKELGRLFGISNWQAIYDHDGVQILSHIE